MTPPAVKHTPTPWQVGLDGQHFGNLDESATPKFRAVGFALNRGIGETRANAEFIVTACNAHDALVECLDVFVQPLGLVLRGGE